MNFIGVLFDLDGTLIHSLPDIAGVINRVRAEYQLPPLAEESVRGHVGRGAEHLIQECFRGELKANPKECLEKFRLYYVETPHWGGYLYPFVRETLDKLRSISKVKLGVVTNKSTASAERSLEYYLPHFSFDTIAGPEKVSQRKPHPAHLLEVMEKLNLNPAQTWFIGDDPIDGLCAERASVHFLLAGYGFAAQAANLPEDKVLQNFSDILQKIPLLKLAIKR